MYVQDDVIVVDFQSYKHAKPVPKCISVARRLDGVCPHAHLANYLVLRGKAQGPLFCHLDVRPISCSLFKKWFELLKNLCKLPAILSLHCIRVGGASYAALQGKSDSEIQRFGRWSGRNFDSYLQFNSTIKL